MIDKSTAEKILKKILSSQHFSGESDQKFLKYLVNAALKDETPKETTIAFEVFERGADFNPAQDSIVRTHIYALRKKLETYYLSDGKDDEVRLVIPKGHYKVEFRIIALKKIPHLLQTIPHYILIGISIFLLIVSIYSWRKNISLSKRIEALTFIEKENPIWKHFLLSEMPTLIIIGDYYVFQQSYQKLGRERFIRDVEINSKEDLVKYIEVHPEEKDRINETNLSYLGKEVPWCLQKLFNIFKGFDKDRVKIKLASCLLWENIHENNIIFIGHFKTLRIMSHFFDRLRFKYQLFPHKIYYCPNHTDTLETISLESYYRHGFHSDFAVVAKFPGGNNNTIMIITSFSSFGKIESLKKLTDSTFPTEILNGKYTNNKTFSPYFEILFRVYGIEHYGYNTEILKFNEADTNIFNNQYNITSDFSSDYTFQVNK